MCPGSRFLGPGISTIIAFFCQGSTAGKDIAEKEKFGAGEHLRAARLQNEIAPEKLLNRYEKRFEKREKRSEN